MDDHSLAFLRGTIKMSGKEKPQWEQISAAKRKALLASLEVLIPDPDILPPDSQLDVTSFPASSGWFKERELEITAASASLILINIKSRTWSAEEVTRAFCKRAGLAHVLVSTVRCPDTGPIKAESTTNMQ